MLRVVALDAVSKVSDTSTTTLRPTICWRLVPFDVVERCEEAHRRYGGRRGRHHRRHSGPEQPLSVWRRRCVAARRFCHWLDIAVRGRVRACHGPRPSTLSPTRMWASQICRP